MSNYTVLFNVHAFVASEVDIKQQSLINRELLRLDVKELTWQLLPFIKEEEMGDPWDTVRRSNFKEETTMALPQSVLSLPKAESSPAL